MEFLVRDLCARLPYNVKVRYKNGNDFTLSPYHLDAMLCALSSENFVHENFVIYPYLRPMSNMTKEEREDYNLITYDIAQREYYGEPWCLIQEGKCDEDYTDIKNHIKYVDWLYAHHFDIHNLIKSGLAIEAPVGMYNFE